MLGRSVDGKNEEQEDGRAECCGERRKHDGSTAFEDVAGLFERVWVGGARRSLVLGGGVRESEEAARVTSASDEASRRGDERRAL